MASRFGRLFTYRARSVSPLENFTTEALAWAVKDDPEPLLSLLRPIINADPTRGRLEVASQVRVAGAGQIDLVIAETGRSPFVWIEVKVDAPESGQQLANYVAAIERLPAETRPKLVTLGKKPLRDDLHHITWQQLRQAAVEGDGGSSIWREFRLFIEEQGMADAFDDPISPPEVDALAFAFSARRKICRVLAQFAALAQDEWPDVQWPQGAERVEDQATKVHVDPGKEGRLFIVGGTERASYPLVGIDPEEGRAAAAVWLESGDLTAASQLIAAADKADLGDSWIRREPRYGSDDFGGLQATRDLSTFGNHDALVAWYLERLCELHQAGLLGPD